MSAPQAIGFKMWNHVTVHFPVAKIAGEEVEAALAHVKRHHPSATDKIPADTFVGIDKDMSTGHLAVAVRHNSEAAPAVFTPGSLNDLLGHVANRFRRHLRFLRSTTSSNAA